MALLNTYFETKGRDVSVPIPDTPSYNPPIPPTPPTPGGGGSADIPIPTFSGTVECQLYRCSSDNNIMDKDLSSMVTYSINFKMPVSKINPSIIITEPSIDIKSCNYMRIDNKYFFIRNIVHERNDVYRIEGHVDVLMTYKNELRALSAIIDRTGSSYNTYLYDSQMKITAYNNVHTLEATQGFSQNLKYYLLTVGDSGSLSKKGGK